MQTSLVPEPPLADEFTVAALDTDVRRDLRGLQKETADTVARHLVAAGSLMDEDPALALAHARYARKRASRIAVVREAAGIAAYHVGEWAEALAELRAARRMGGGPMHLPVMADIERALGRPERAVDIARGPEAAELGTAGRIELAIVGAGARRDLGELEAAVVGLQIPELDPTRRDPWSARLFYAYADNLLAAGRESDALQWFVHAVDADDAGTTDAAARIAELTGEDMDDDFEFGEEQVAAAGAPVEDVPASPAPVDHEAEVPDQEPGGAEPGGAEPDGAEPDGAEPDGAEPDGTEPDGAEPDGAEPDGTEPDGTEPDGTEPDAGEVVEVSETQTVPEADGGPAEGSR